MNVNLSKIVNRATDSQGYELIEKFHHDTRGISPLHITVISAISEVLDLDPTEDHLDLSSYYSIRAIDDLVDESDSDLATLSFRYDKFESDLKVVAANNGTVLIYGPEGG